MTLRSNPVIEPRPERNVMEVFLLGLALQSAVVAVFAPDRPSVEVLLGPVWAFVWGAGLFTGAGLVLAGLFWRWRPGTGLLLQQLGYAAFAPMSLARGVALLGVDSRGDAVIVLAFAAAATMRLAQLQRRLGRRPPRGWWRRWWVRAC